MSTEKLRVAVIGAGASGLTAIKCCLDEGLEVVCLERSNRIGGLWHFTDDAQDGQACVMKSTVINTSKEMMCYSDYPIPEDFPNFMHNRTLMNYFYKYMENFGLEKFIQYNTEVLKVEKSDDFEKTGKWNISLKEGDKEERKEIYDAVLVCTGHHADKNVPYFPGQENFKGKIVHSHDYKDHKGFEDKRVVVIGIGNSGVDVATELGRPCQQVYLSTRRGAWVWRRVASQGLPLDIVLTRRSRLALLNALPRSISESQLRKELNEQVNHDRFGLTPKHGIFQAHPTVNDELPNRILCGSVIVKPNIKGFTTNGVEFEDGTHADNIDAVILCTGYVFGFPFLSNDVLEVKNNVADLYKFVWPAHVKGHTLAVVGYIQPLGAINPISEIQCRWAARVFKGLSHLPNEDAMMKDITKKRDAMAARYVESQRHTIQVDWIPYMDELAEQFGVKPDLWKLARTDPTLAWECFFGPCSPYQYRLMGPGKWKGARKAIMTQMDRVNAALATRKVTKSTDMDFGMTLVLGAILIVMIAVLSGLII